MRSLNGDPSQPSPQPARPQEARRASKLATLAIIAIYTVVIVCTNNAFTILDDECNSIALAGQPVIPTLQLFFAGEGLHEEHPPSSDILLHFWLVATRYSFFALRIFANIFYIAGILITALSAEKIGGKRTYWSPSPWDSPGHLRFSMDASPDGIAYPCSLCPWSRGLTCVYSMTEAIGRGRHSELQACCWFGQTILALPFSFCCF